MAVDPAGDERHGAALGADMKLRGARAEGVLGDARGVFDRHLQGAARVGGPHAAMLDAKRAAASARRNLGGIGLPGERKRNVPAVTLALNQHLYKLLSIGRLPAVAFLALEQFAQVRAPPLGRGNPLAP